MSVMAFASRCGRRLYSTVIPGREANPESRDSPMCNCTSEVWSGACHRAAPCADPLGPSRNDGASRSAIPLRCGNSRFLRDVDVAELPHLLLPFLLLLQNFAFAGNVAAVALCGDVL